MGVYDFFQQIFYSPTVLCPSRGHLLPSFLGPVPCEHTDFNVAWKFLFFNCIPFLGSWWNSLGEYASVK